MSTLAVLRCPFWTERWFALPRNTGGRIWTSPDGTHYSMANLATSFSVRDVACNPFENSYCVVFGATGYISARSTDGSSWSVSGQTSNCTWEGVDFDVFSEKYVAVASAGTNRIAYSSDGLNWTLIATASTVNFRCVRYSFETRVMMAIASTGADRCWTSTDAINWVHGPAIISGGWINMSRSDRLKMWITVAASGTQRIARLVDGGSWTYPTIAGSPALNSVQWCDNLNVWLACGGTTSALLYYSWDGISWSSLAAPSGTGLNGVAWSFTHGLMGVVNTGASAAVKICGPALLPMDSSGAPAPVVAQGLNMPAPDISGFTLSHSVVNGKDRLTLSPAKELPFPDALVALGVWFGSPLTGARKTYNGCFRFAGVAALAGAPWLTASADSPLPFPLVAGMRIPLRLRYYGRGGRMSDFAEGVWTV